MGYRDALIGGGLLVAGVRDSRAEGGWFLASAGADASDLIGGLAVRHELSERDHLIGLGGAQDGRIRLTKETASDFLDLVEGRLFNDDVTGEERRADAYSPRTTP